MSYILDALKKSDRERPPGPVPDLFTVHGPQPPPPRRPTRAIVVLALLLAVPAIAFWAWREKDHRDEGAGRPPAAVSAPRPAEAPAVPVTAQTVAPAPPSRPARAAVGVGRKAAPERSPAAASPAQKSHETALPSGAPTSLPAALPAAAAPAAPPAPVETSPALTLFAPVMALPESEALSPPAPTGGELQPAPTSEPPSSSEMVLPDFPAPPPVSVAEPPSEAVPAEQVPPEDGRVLDLEELPAQIRAELPKLLVSGHVWSEEPSLRLLSVDDQLLREGGEAAPGVSLREITPKGAVFVFKGWRFRVAGGRP